MHIKLTRAACPSAGMEQEIKYDIETTYVRGIICRACNKELPVMTMKEHLDGRGCPCRVDVTEPEYNDRHYLSWEKRANEWAQLTAKELIANYNKGDRHIKIMSNQTKQVMTYYMMKVWHLLNSSGIFADYNIRQINENTIRICIHMSKIDKFEEAQRFMVATYGDNAHAVAQALLAHISS